ncbi:flagellar biosynthesis protein FlhF [Marinicrinis lubricantis]|uniref:Flagellar biosynthesis protein FlhF n=1 Tax=Marinicrinis lubricantis TaxID=2086470 RepID=A0ABW1IMG1_9BACL
MRVKRYLVDTMPDALHKIRADLGKDAVIINTKEIKVGGFLGLFRKKKIEVIAALDSNEKPTPVTTAANLDSFTEALKSAQTNVLKPEVESAIEQAPIIPPVMTARSERVSASTRYQPTYERSSTNRPSSSEPMGEHIWDELKQLKEMLKKLNHLQTEGTPSLPEGFQTYKELLLQHGVMREIVDSIMEQAMDANKSAAGQAAEVASEAVPFIRSVMQNILPEERFEGLNEHARIVNFVGPTGVGKTTTIAKLAAEQVLKQNKKVGFITSDTYRISAVEQLRTYANILNVPLEVVFSPQELIKAFQKLEDCDLIFMDTAGRNYRNEMFVSELNSLLSSHESSETYLVLSLAAKYADMKLITKNFSKFKLDKVLFTKLDETETYGAILNIAYEFPLKLSYITNGQNVPQDIECMQQNDILELLLGEDGHG